MPEQKALAGSVAVVTGGGRGIGAAIAKRLAELGASVAVCGRTLKPLQETAKSIMKGGGNAMPVECDVTDYASIERGAKRIASVLGAPKILVNNAGIGAFSQPLHEMGLQEWDDLLNTNLRGVFYCIHAFAPEMIKSGGGHIINISSLAGKNALPKGAAYAASKWGLNGLSYSVAEELRGHNIRVSVVCPGSVDTELSPHEGKNKAKMLKPEDVAHAVAMLVTQAPQSFVSELLIRPTQKP
jgi:3-oxoacyl-[acyl-carrier protein] reductase